MRTRSADHPGYGLGAADVDDRALAGGAVINNVYCSLSIVGNIRSLIDVYVTFRSSCGMTSITPSSGK